MSQNLNKRLSDLEEKREADGGQHHVLVVRDSGRTRSYHAWLPHEHVMQLPTSKSIWQDGSLVFDSMSCPPTDNDYSRLSEEQWEELRRAELLHQKESRE